MPESTAHRSIADLADETGMSAHTLRYYERIGLLAPIARSESGHRVYDAFATEWVVLLGHLRETGMPIRTMQAFAALVRDGENTVPARIALLQEHKESIARQMRVLTDALARVDAKLDAYTSGDAVTPTRGED